MSAKGAVNLARWIRRNGAGARVADMLEQNDWIILVEGDSLENFRIHHHEKGDIFQTDNLQRTLELSQADARRRNPRNAFSHPNLTARELLLILRRYQPDGRIAATLEEVGESMDLSRERVRQLEGRAMRKLAGIALRQAVDEKIHEARALMEEAWKLDAAPSAEDPE